MSAQSLGAATGSFGQPPAPIAFIDLQAQRLRIAAKIDAAVRKVIEGGAYVMGPEVRAFETQLAAFGDAKYALSCGNGTDALVLPLEAWGVGAGDAVFCPSFTFAATAEIVPWTNAQPVFVDIVPETYNIDPVKLEAAIEGVLKDGKLKPKVIIAVDLFGQPADYPAIAALAQKYGLKLIADSAQGFGCRINGKHPLAWADATTTSFFPAKPLGCYGDGGAVLTNEAATAELIDSFRVHGKATATDIANERFEHDPKYLNLRIGRNSRLDTIQAAILLEKLAVFADEILARNAIATRYCEGLRGFVSVVPKVIDGGVSTWAQFTIEHPERDKLAAHLKNRGVPTACYYPIPLHLQKAYKHFPRGAGGMDVTEAKAHTVLSLPMHADLSQEVQDYIIDAVKSF